MQLNKYFYYSILFTLFLFIFFATFSFVTNAYLTKTQSANGIIYLGEANLVFQQDVPLFDGMKFEPGQDFDYDISVANAYNETSNNASKLIDCYLRFQIEFKSDGESVDVVTPKLQEDESWILGSDGYYYYKDIFKVGDVVQLVSGFVIGENISSSILENGVEVNLTAQSLQQLGNPISNGWTTAPDEWLEVVL